MNDDESSEQICDFIRQVVDFALLRESAGDLLHKGYSCAVVCCSADRIREYNSQYRDKDYVTDILSFPQEAGAMAEFMPGEEDGIRDIGDMLICQSQISVQAGEYEVDYEEEFMRVLVHGTLHLLGYTHDSYNMREEPMLRRQETIVSDFIREKRGMV